MNAFRKQVEDYLKLWPNNPAIASYDFSKDEIHYGTRRDNRSISKLPGDEEYVRAYIVTKLVNIKTLLEKERFKYNYGRSFKMELIKNTILKLQSDLKGNPDWIEVENYIKSIPYADRI